MEISSPVLVRSSNPTAANLIDSAKVSSGGSSGASAAGHGSGSTSPSGAAGATAGEALAGGSSGMTGRKKPAPLMVSEKLIENQVLFDRIL